jgi:hypothetical protein
MIFFRGYITMIKLYKKTIQLLTLMLISIATLSMDGSSHSGDPYGGIIYSQVFEQTEIYKKYKTVLDQTECACNIFSPEETTNPQANKLNPEEIRIKLQELEQECLAQLHHARTLTLARPLRMTLTKMGLVLSTMYITKILTEKFKSSTTPNAPASNDGLAMFFSAGDLIWRLPDLINSSYNLLYRPDNLLGDLEDHFAKNKCYIPQALWPKITSSFAAARQGGYNQEMHINFLKFVLNLTIYKPKQTLSFAHNLSQDEVKQELCNRIQSYFADYKDLDIQDSLIEIQINILKFIDELVSSRNRTTGQGPRHIYLHGIGGIGKTHFVQTLASWVEELIPNSVRFEEIVINSADELEGNEQKPGAFLKILRNQLMQNKRGSIIMLDEATWLNDACIVNAAKRVFNGDRSKLSTSYFGSNIDGTAVALDIPPMLIFVASNEEIKDKALASRFDIMKYPNPTIPALVQHAVTAAQNSKILQSKNIVTDQDTIKKWIESLSEENQNFRYVAGKIEMFLLSQAYKK